MSGIRNWAKQTLLGAYIISQYLTRDRWLFSGADGKPRPGAFIITKIAEISVETQMERSVSVSSVESPLEVVHIVH